MKNNSFIESVEETLGVTPEENRDPIPKIMLLVECI